MTREGEAGAIHHIKPKEMKALKRHKNGLRKPLTLPLAYCERQSSLCPVFQCKLSPFGEMFFVSREHISGDDRVAISEPRVPFQTCYRLSRLSLCTHSLEIHSPLHLISSAGQSAPRLQPDLISHSRPVTCASCSRRESERDQITFRCLKSRPRSEGIPLHPVTRSCRADPLLMQHLALCR